MATIQESYTAGEDSDVEINADVNSVSAQAMVFTIGTTGNNLTFDPTSVEVRLKKQELLLMMLLLQFKILIQIIVLMEI